ncbi:amidohydrolase family protein [Streptomyces brasiliensis]|uniref:Amidohydrolase n=1 Tax=Streptomyces brasiliensis TaxID=1954 RepID=A0A917L3A3_9ACTN|nr:amidohydrolase family protein [Streptomyces brasiliensis]GGJ40421.1 amidohydrolase [Streptomyces brasiliensis]
MTAPERVDAHHHVWDLRRRPQPWTEGVPALRRSFSFEELKPQLVANGVGATVVVHTVASLDETHELLRLSAGQPAITGVVGWFDLASPALADDLAAARAIPGGGHLVGVRHQLQEEPDTQWLDRPAVRRGLRTLAGHELAYDIVVSPEQLPTAVQAVTENLELRFVLDHAGKPPLRTGALASWKRDLTRLALLDNVTVKLSGLVTEADWQRWSVADLRPVAETVLDLFSPGRTMFGSDWPVCLAAGADYARVADTFEELVRGLDETERALVWGGTARRAYRSEAG